MVGPDRSVPVVLPRLPLLVIDETHVFSGDELHAGPNARYFANQWRRGTAAADTPTLAFGRSCGPSCRHREFDLPADQATSTHEAALAIAALRVLRGRGRQRVTRHVSTVWKRGIWFVQDTHALPASARTGNWELP